MAAIEFAVIMPVLITIMLGGIQLVTYTNASRRVDLVVRSISEMLSQAVPPANSSTATVNAVDLHFAYDSAMVTFPYLLTDAKARGIAWWQGIVINFASIKFTPTLAICPASGDQSPCKLASVVWTSTGVNSANYRPCVIPQLPADDTSAPSPATLPRSVFGSSSIIVVDVVFTFRPSFGAGIVPPIRIARTAYIQPRYATLIDFDTTNNDGIASKCLGF
ncbi:MAG: TadE family protein [Methylobacterium sp.]